MPDIQAQTPDGVTHNFPDGTPDDVVDKVIKNHVQNVMPYSEKGAAAAPPVSPQPLAGDIREKGRVQKIGAPSELTGTSASPSEDAQTAGITSTALGAVASPLRTAQGLVGSTVGAYGGGKTGKYLAGDTGETIGKIGGGLLGGVAGYAADIPGQYTIGGVNLKNPFASPYATADPTGELGVKAHGEMESDIANEQQQRAAAKIQMDTEIAKGHQNRVGAYSEMQNDIQEGRQGKAAARDTAYNDLAEARVRRGREQGRIDDGAPVEGSSQKVLIVPEPNPVPPGENPNNQQSVSRRTTLVQNAKRAKEGAGTQLNQIHGPVLYESKGAGYSGVREQVPLGEQPPISGGSEGTVGKGPITTKPLTGGSGLNTLPHVDELEEAFRQKGMTGVDAHRAAQETLDEASGGTTVPQANRQMALDRIKRIMGPEQRGPVRLGPEGRGIK